MPENVPISTRRTTYSSSNTSASSCLLLPLLASPLDLSRLNKTRNLGDQFAALIARELLYKVEWLYTKYTSRYIRVPGMHQF